MNRHTFLFLIVLLLQGPADSLRAQEVITPAAGNAIAAEFHAKARPVFKATGTDTIDLPFFDEFSNSHVSPDASKWTNAYTFVNNSYCISPVSNGVVTLDALNRDGGVYAHAVIDPRTFGADTLSSHPIRLDYNASDSLYLSFFYQAGGLGDLPQENDSLLLEFFSPLDKTWSGVWGTPGIPLDDFRQVMIPITDERFLTNGFRFRFRNLASLPANDDYPDKRGNADLWHLDYIKLDAGRSAADTVIRDVAFVSPIQSILKDLSAVPWSHFENAYTTILDDEIPVRYRNNDTISHNVTRSLLISEPAWDESFEPGEPSAMDLAAGEEATVEFSYIYPLIDFNRGDSALFRFRASLRTDQNDPKVNDTVWHDQLFRDYYAYDDGSAEAGYGLRGQGTSNGNVALRFNSYQPDMIGGLEISFNQMMDSINMGYYFKLMVWADNGGKPGAIIYEGENDHTPAYPGTYPGFVRYYFPEPVQVEGPFYAGWRQYNEYLLNVGLDMNNVPDPHVMFYNFQGTWNASEAPGVIMIRPFLYDPAVSIEATEIKSSSMEVYPNPCSDFIHLRVPGFVSGQELEVQLYDTSGRMILHNRLHDTRLSLSGLSRGIYFLKARTGERSYQAKVLIR